MSDLALQKNVAAFLLPVPMIDPVVETGSTTSSSGGISVTSQSIDRFAQIPPWQNSMALEFQYLATIAGSTGNNDTQFTVAQSIQSAPDNSTWTNIPSPQAQPASVKIGTTNSTGTQTLRGIIQNAVDLTAAARYLRSVVTITTSTTVADTLAIAQSAILGGLDRVAGGAGLASGIE